MGRVRVFGAGECGLPLARRLLDGGVPVTLVTDRTAEQVLNGSVTSTQVKFPARSIARRGLRRDLCAPGHHVRSRCGTDVLSNP